MTSAPAADPTPGSGNLSGTPLHTAFDQFMAYKSGQADATQRAYRSDYAGICEAITSHTGTPSDLLTVSDALDKTVLWKAFGTRFKGRPTSSLKRCWSTWNGLCEFLVDQEYIAANPMKSVPNRNAGPPPAPPKSLEEPDVHRMLTQLAMPDPDSPNDWRERDLALILSGLLLGFRTGDMISLNIGDFSPHHEEPGTMTVRILGKGSKYRILVAEEGLTQILEAYLASRARRFPDTVPVGRRSKRKPWRKFAPEQPLFVGADGQRITRGTVQYRTKRAYARAGITPTPGANTHRLRHSFAIALAESGVPVHVLKDLLGHSTLASTQKYLEASGQATRNASRSNPYYAALPHQK